MPDNFAKAKLTSQDPQVEITVQFNPASLQYTIQNQQEQNQQPTQGQSTQYITKSTAQLTMDLIFDTTMTGANVEDLTRPIAQLLQPKENDDGSRVAPPEVRFEWGSFAFRGMITQFRETIDFFHSTGVPLRSSVNLTMTALSLQFDKGGGAQSANTAGSAGATQAAPGTSPQSLATQGGNPSAARGVAASNGVESVRFSKGPLTVSGSVQLKSPAAFASAGGGAGASAGAGFGAGVGGGIGGGAGIGGSIGGGISGGASSGASFKAGFGGSSSAGVSASAGAFAGIGKSASANASFKLNTNKLLQAGGSFGVSTGAGANFNLGGQAGMSASGGVSARIDVSGEDKVQIIFSTDDGQR